MTKFLIHGLLLVGVISLSVTACAGFGYVVGTGPTVDQSYDLNNFKNIEISNALGFEINYSDNYSVTISAHENLISHMDVKKDGDTLIVRMKPGSYTNSETRAIINLPELNSLTVSGASRGSARGFKSDHLMDISTSGSSQLELDVETGRTRLDIAGASKLSGSLNTQNVLGSISGASKLTGVVTAQNAQFTVSGASGCEINGSASSSNIEISGASHFTAPAFEITDCTIRASGASSARILATGTLNIEASGASTVKYSGDPRIKGLNVSGASHAGHE